MSNVFNMYFQQYKIYRIVFNVHVKKIYNINCILYSKYCNINVIKLRNYLENKRVSTTFDIKSWFQRLWPGLNVIKLFMAVIYKLQRSVPGKPFQPILMFVRPNPTRMKHLLVAPLFGKLLATPNIRQGAKAHQGQTL
jgi:hypothetical protein